MGFVNRDIFSKPEELAKHMYETLKDSFDEMSDEEFKRWLDSEMEKPYIRLESQDIAIATKFKKAMCYYLGFLYHSAVFSK